MTANNPLVPLFRDDLDYVATHTRDLWAEARGQSFFITGGTGFFGMWLLETFAYANDLFALGMCVTVLTRNVGAFRVKAPHLAQRSDIVFIEGDIRNFAYPFGEYKYIIHAATAASARLIADAPREMLDTIIGGTRRILDFVGRPTTRAQKFLFTSSGAVYGRQPPSMSHIPETYNGAPDPLALGAAYGVGKLVAEHMCVVDAARYGYEVKLARCFAFVGPHLPLDTHFAIGNFIRDAISGGPIRVNGDGTPYRSYLYAADLVIWLWTILFRGGSARAYNVGSADGMPIGTWAGIVRETLCKKSRVIIEKQPSEGVAPFRYVPATQRAQHELGLSENITFQGALVRTANWLRSQTQ